MRRDSNVRREWPSCDGDSGRKHCCKPAVIVCASSAWEASGFVDNEDGTRREAHFCCLKHTDMTERWYWFWLVPSDERDDSCPTIQDWDFIVHLTKKTWGVPFLSWLLTRFDLSSYSQKGSKS